MKELDETSIDATAKVAPQESSESNIFDSIPVEENIFDSVPTEEPNELDVALMQQQEEEQIDQETERTGFDGFMDTVQREGDKLLFDVAGGAVNGAIGFGHSIADLEADVLNTITGQINKEFGTDLKDDFSAPEGARFKTGIAGDLTEGLTQFGLGFYTGGALLNGANIANTFVRSTLAGGIGDFLAFTEDEERLSNLIQDNPALANPITEYLAASPNDNWAEGRLKNTLEGFGLGMGVDGLIKSLSGLKKASGLLKADKVKAARETVEATRDEVRKIFTETSTEATPKVKPPKEYLNEEQVNEAFRRMRSNDGDLSDVSEAFNPDKWENAEEGKKLIDAFVEKLKVSEPEAFSDVQTFESVKRTAELFGENPEKLRAAVLAQAKDAEDWAATVVSLETKTITAADHIARTARIITEAGGDVSDEVIAKAMDSFNMLAENMTSLKILKKNHARATGAGRMVKEAGEVAPEAMSPEDMVKAFNDFEGDQMRFFQYVGKMEKKNRSAVTRMVRYVLNNKTWDIANEVFINGILSGPKTHLVNFTSNTVETLVKPIEGFMAAGFRGDKTGMLKAMKQYAGLRHAISDSWQMARWAFENEKNVLDPLHAVNESQPMHAIKGVKGQVIRMPSRFMLGADEFMKQINYRGSVYADNYAKAIERGMDAKEAHELALDLVNKSIDPDTGAARLANELQYARESTFTEDLEYGIGKSIQGMTVKHPWMRQIVPFVRTPTNLIRHNIRRIPALNMIDDWSRKAVLGELGPKAQSEAFAQLTMGTSVISMAALMASNGMIEGAAPQDPNLRRQFFDSGRKEYSFNLPGGKQFSFSRLDPRFAMFGIVADTVNNINDMAEGDRDAASAGLIFALSLSRNLMSKSYLRGVSETLETLASGEEDKWDRYFAWQLGARVPYSSLLNSVNVVDDELKELRTWSDGILARVPGFSEEVEAKRNALGEKMYRGGVFLGSKGQDALKEELYQLGEGFGLPPKKVNGSRVDMTLYKNSEGQTAYDRYQELTAEVTDSGKTLRQALDEVIGDKSYKNLPVIGSAHPTRSDRAKVISRVIQSYRLAAYEKLLKEFPMLEQDINIEKENGAIARTKGVDFLKPLLNEKIK